jgi:lysozyme
MRNSAQTYVLGIDSSKYQGVIDWNEVAQSPTAFDIGRASYGANLVDARFSANWRGAQAAGLKRGAYHFFLPTEDVQSQVNIFTSTVGPLLPGDLQPALDLEDSARLPNWSRVPMSARMPRTLQWLQAVEAAMGVRPMIYSTAAFINEVFDDPTPLTAYDLWVAHYTSAAAPTLPNGFTKWLFWQWSDAASVPGITGAVDSNRFSGSLQDLAQLGVPQPASVSAKKQAV